MVMKVFPRNLEGYLREWSARSARKPLVIRGARQTGKTTTVLKFAEHYPQYIHLNLDRYEDRRIFNKERALHGIVDELFFLRGLQKERKTLIFIDEIQRSGRAVNLLRYLHEDYPEYHIVAAGSLLEQTVDVKSAFPVGRVTYAYMHPVSFEEFLLALGETQAAEAYQQVPVPEYAHEKLLELFHRYTLVGGMPEAVRTYAESGDLLSVRQVYHDLITSYADDLEKYPLSESRRAVVRHVFSTMLLHPMQRLTFNGYGGSNYSSIQVKEAFEMLEKAMLCTVEYPLTSTGLPLQRIKRKKPRLHILDTGLCAYAMGVQDELISIHDLTDARKGLFAEHIVGQELHSLSYTELFGYLYWVREKSQSSAEVDYLVLVDGRIIPVEVKSGAVGRLRSLMQFLDMSDERCGVRLYSGAHSIDSITTMNKKPFLLLNIPYYHAAKVSEYVRTLCPSADNSTVR